MTAKISLFKKSILTIILLLTVRASIFAKTKSASSANLRSVVALSKSVAEMWLLAGGTLTGTTEDGLDLIGAENAVSVGTLTTSSLEAIISLNPDFVILTQDIPLHKKLYGNLKAFGIKTYIADVKNFSDYDKVMSDFTELTGRKDLYKKNVLSVKTEIEEILELFKNESGEVNGKSYLFLRVSAAKNKVLKEHFGNEIFQSFGLKSIVEDNSKLDEIGIEAILSADPDYIFVVQQGNQKNAEQAFYKAFESNPAWNSLSAVKNKKVYILPKELFNYKPNAHWAKAYEIVAELLQIQAKS